MMRTRHSGVDIKPPLGAAAKSCGAERKGKGWTHGDGSCVFTGQKNEGKCMGYDYSVVG